VTGIPLFFTADTHFNDHRTLDAGAYADRGRFELEEDGLHGRRAT
jgi:hypothetical protein